MPRLDSMKMRLTHEFRATRTFSITATDVRSMNQIIAHYEKLGYGVACLSHEAGTNKDDFEFIARISKGELRNAGKIYDVRVYANGISPVNELERVTIVDLQKD